MRNKYQLIIVGGLLLSLLLVGLGRAQSPTALDGLNIALWPEYDQPQVLVIFRGSVAEDVPLPAPVSFNLPASVEAMHAVAYLDEDRGALVNVPEFNFAAGAEGKVLSFATPGRQFQFEYYDGGVLGTNGGARDLAFSFTPSADVANLSFELQQPTSAQAFSSDPPPSTTQVRQDGLTYALYEVGTVPAGNPRSLQASYTRSSDELSVNSVEGVSIPSSPQQTPVEVAGGGVKDSLGPILIAVGILLLIGSLGYWFWSQRSVVVPEPAQRQPSAPPDRAPRKRQPRGSRSTPSTKAEEKLAAYCHRCGTKLRGNARFCHACGAERRAE